MHELIQTSPENTLRWSPMFLFLEDAWSYFFDPQAYPNHPGVSDDQYTHQGIQSFQFSHMCAFQLKSIWLHILKHIFNVPSFGISFYAHSGLTVGTDDQPTLCDSFWNWWLIGLEGRPDLFPLSPDEKSLPVDMDLSYETINWPESSFL